MFNKTIVLALASLLVFGCSTAEEPCQVEQDASDDCIASCETECDLDSFVIQIQREYGEPFSDDFSLGQWCDVFKKSICGYKECCPSCSDELQARLQCQTANSVTSDNFCVVADLNCDEINVQVPLKSRDTVSGGASPDVLRVNETNETSSSFTTEIPTTPSPTGSPTLSPTGNSTNATEGEPTNPNDAQTLLNTLIIYGSLFVILWLLFCWLRLRNPRTFNIRGWVKDIRCKLALNQYGFFDWFWEVYNTPEKQFMDQCGVDSLCMVRLLAWAAKVSVVGVINAIWLIPVYGSAETSEKTAYLTDPIASITTAHVPPSSPRFFATMIASYVLFGAALYLLYQEFDWFQRFRHRFLSQARSRNYTVYVHGLHDEHRADYDLADFFQVSFGLGRVQEAHVRLDTPELLKLTLKRDVLVQKLEHAINVLNVQKVRPTHKVNRFDVDSIETYAYELRDMNLEITQRIEFLEAGGFNDSEEKDPQMELEMQVQGEGQPLDGGFVTFYNLSSKQAAIQMNHSREPFGMQVIEAPDPDDVLWPNVGKGHAQIQVGNLTSLVLTITLCLLWTIPIAFFSGLSNIEGLEGQFPELKTVNDANPWLRAVIAQVAPFLVVIVNALLPVILKALSTMECHISNGMVKASLFTKLASFQIIQTFFVSAISGTVVSQMSAFIKQPNLIIDLLANELPTKSTFFIQLILISTVLGLGIEQLRVGPAFMASLRGCFGPNLTEDERNSPWLFLSPIAVPPIFNLASALSQVVLFVMVLFVYAVIAPLTSIVLAVAFLILGAGYRHQFIYIYPPQQESGGRLWISFVHIILNCMVVAQIVILGLLGIKKAPIASALMVPLIVWTLLFKSYIGQRHFKAVECLPSYDCHRKDTSSDFYITESFEDLFVQPELLIKEAFPGNIDGDLLNQISLIERKNPNKMKKLKKKKQKTPGEPSIVTETAKTEPPPDTENDIEVPPPPGTPPASV